MAPAKRKHAAFGGVYQPEPKGEADGQMHDEGQDKGEV